MNSPTPSSRKDVPHHRLAPVVLALVLVVPACSMQDFGGGAIGDEPETLTTEAADAAKAAERSEKLSSMLLALQQQGRAEDDYRIGPNDVLDISVFSLERPGVPTLITRAVDAAGLVSLPFAGDVAVTNLTVRQIVQAVTSAYEGKYLKNPQVSVTVKEFRSALVVVTGAVKLPGAFYLRRNRSTVLEMLSLANGLSAEAGNELLIVRGRRPQDASAQRLADAAPAEPGTAAVATPAVLADSTAAAPPVAASAPAAPDTAPPAPTAADTPVTDESGIEMLTVDLRRLLDAGDLAQNLDIRGGDVISVPLRKPQFVFVLGYVQRPGKLELPAGQQIEALQAIAMAGGLSTAARAANTTLITQQNGMRRTMAVDLTRNKRGTAPPVVMQPGDILIVGSSPLAKLAEFIKVSAGANVSPLP